jgi:HSP20 family protein
VQHPRARIVSCDLVRTRSEEIRDAVAQRAYEIFERRGRVDGHHEEDWRQAESELLFPLAVTVADAGECLTVAAAVPGFDACDVEVFVEPRRVTIAGQRHAEAAGPEHRTRMFRAVELPEDVTTCDVIAEVEDGVVAVTLRKVTGSEGMPPE